MARLPLNNYFVLLVQRDPTFFSKRILKNVQLSIGVIFLRFVEENGVLVPSSVDNVTFVSGIRTQIRLGLFIPLYLNHGTDRLPACINRSSPHRFNEETGCSGREILRETKKTYTCVLRKAEFGIQLHNSTFLWFLFLRRGN